MEVKFRFGSTVAVEEYFHQKRRRFMFQLHILPFPFSIPFTPHSYSYPYSHSHSSYLHHITYHNTTQPFQLEPLPTNNLEDAKDNS